MYGYRFNARADREIRALTLRAPKPDVNRLLEAIDDLSTDPRPFGSVKMKGSKNGYRIRVGDYRILYEINEKEHIIIITRVLRRNETTYRT